MAVLEMTAARMGGYRGQTREEGLRSAQAADRRYRRIREDALHFLQRRCHNSARQHALWGSRIRTLIATWVAVSLSSPLHTVPYAPLAIHDVREYLRPDVLRHVSEGACGARSVVGRGSAPGAKFPELHRVRAALQANFPSPVPEIADTLRLSWRHEVGEHDYKSK